MAAADAGVADVAGVAALLAGVGAAGFGGKLGEVAGVGSADDGWLGVGSATWGSGPGSPGFSPGRTQW